MSAAINWRDRVTATEHELRVVLIILAGALDHRYVAEADWQRLATSLHRIEALRAVRA